MSSVKYMSAIQHLLLWSKERRAELSWYGSCGQRGIVGHFQWSVGISNRLIFPRLAKGNEEVWIVGAYAPTNVSKEAAKVEFYDQLHDTLRKVPVSGMLIFLVPTYQRQWFAPA